MSTFGCHRCKVNLKDWEGKPYEEWPCASCSLSKDYSRTFNTGYFDTGKAEEDESEGYDPFSSEDEHELVVSDTVKLTEDEIHSLETIQAAISNQIYAMFSGILVKLLYMAKTNPVMFEVFIKKMQFPYMSYSEIGDTMEPKCSKQNVLYHLKCVVEQFPELLSIIQTDTRYSAGKYALKTVADRKRQQIAEERAQKIIYGDKYAPFRYMDMKELNKILRLPFNMRDEVFTFNAYLDDERHIQDTEEEEDGGAPEDKD